jgi:hypothetical protein
MNIFKYLFLLALIFAPSISFGATLFSTVGPYVPTEVPFGRGLLQPTDNFAEIAGFKIMDTWNIDNVRSVGVAVCRETGINNLTLVAQHISETGVSLATSSPVLFTNVQYCNQISTSSASVLPLTYFDFSTAFDFKDRSYIIIRPLEFTSTDTGMRMFGANDNEIVPLTNKNCYLNDSSGGFSCPYDGFFQLPVLKLSDTLSSSTNSSIPEYTVGSFSTLNTHFISASTTNVNVGNNVNDVKFDVVYYVDPAERNTSLATRNPTLVSVTLGQTGNSGVATIGNYMSSSTGTGTASITFPDSSLANDGYYTALVKFSSIACAIDTSKCPFPEVYLYFDFRIVNHVVTNVTQVENYNLTQPLVTSEQQTCSLSNFTGCIVNAMMYLFVPSNSAISAFKDSIVSSDFPLLAVAYDAYSNFQHAPDATPTVDSGSGLSVNLTVPQAGIDVPMFSVALLSSGLGDARPIFRGIALIALYLGFLYMIWNTVSGIFGYSEVHSSGQSDVEFSGGISGPRGNYHGSHKRVM